MSQERWREMESLFDRAAALPEGDRQRFLDENTAGDPSLGAEVRHLIAAHERPHPLLDAPPSSELPQGVRLGPYEVDAVLGSGGMGTVYLAHRADRQFHKQVAIKVVTGLHAAIEDRHFRTERQILAALEHPNITRLLDSGVNEFGQPFLVMEHVDGKPLDSWRQEQDASLDLCLDVWLQVAAAVGYAHRSLVIHRDLKPSNILVNQAGEAKLLDFGIARLRMDTSAETATRSFTPLYASPEQIRGDVVTTATDIYSLGLILYELLAGVHPYRGDGRSTHQVAEAILREDARMPPGVPADLAAIVEMALRKDPQRRYLTVDQFAEDVRRFRRGLPVMAQPETVLYRVRKFVGRHRVAVGLASAAALAMIASTTLALVQAARADRQLARAEKVSGYLAQIMGVTPTGVSTGLRGKGISLRVVELVDEVTARVDRELGNQPEVEATLRLAVGSAYNQLGLWDKAHRHSLRALALFDRLYARDDPRRLNALILDATVNTYLGNWQDAERQSLEADRLWKNPPPYTLAAIVSNLGIAQFRLGKLDLAEQTLLRCMASMEASVGPNDPWLGLVASDLSNVYQERGQYEVAMRYLEPAVAGARASKAYESLGLALLNLSVVQRHLGLPEATLRSAQEAHTAYVESLGESHPLTAQTLLMMAWAKSMVGEKDAEAYARKGVAIQSAQLPPGHQERALGLSFLGFVLMRGNKLEEARQSLAEALELRRKGLKGPNWRIADAAG